MQSRFVHSGVELNGLPVEVAIARADTVIDAILATGAIEAVQSIELRPEVQGRLKEILAREGSEVESGAPLFKVDDAELTAQVAQLRAERDRAVSALERTRELIEHIRRFGYADYKERLS